VPPHLRDGHYSGAAALGNAQGYKYSHDDPDGVVPQQYPPDEVVGVRLLPATGRGAERDPRHPVGESCARSSGASAAKGQASSW